MRYAVSFVHGGENGRSVAVGEIDERPKYECRELSRSPDRFQPLEKKLVEKTKTRSHSER